MRDRADYIKYFRSLDKALDEHKHKSTRPGDAVYSIIHDQLAEDLAPYGFGKDELRGVAERCGHLSTYERLENLMAKEHSPEVKHAVGLLRKQIDRVNQIGDGSDPVFAEWFATTTDLFRKLRVSDSQKVKMFEHISFYPDENALRLKYGTVAQMAKVAEPDYRAAYNKGRDVAINLIKGVIEEIETFGIAPAHPSDGSQKSTPTSAQSGGIQQHFYGNVTIQNQALAADNAIQHVDQSSHVGPDLREIRKLLSESLDITGRQFGDALQAIEKIASETRKPAKGRDWKSMATWGATLLEIVSKASDVAVRVGPHMMAVTQFIQTGAKHFGL